MTELVLYSVFGCGALIFLGEFLLDIELLRFAALPIQYFGTTLLFVLLPWAYYVMVESRTLQNPPRRSGPRRFVFRILSWVFYFSCIIILVLGLGGWSWMFSHLRGWLTTFGVSGMVATVFMVSSVFVVDSKEFTVVGDAFVTIGKKLRIFFSMKVMLTVSAVLLAILAEVNWIKHNNSRLAALEASLALGLFIISLFNTHGVAGRLKYYQHPDVPVSMLQSNWNFFQPFVGGAKFVILQIISWMLFGFGVVFEVAFILSTLAIGLEIFIGITAVAGACCMISEVLMIMSLSYFEAPKSSRTESTDQGPSNNPLEDITHTSSTDKTNKTSEDKTSQERSYFDKIISLKEVSVLRGIEQKLSNSILYFHALIPAVIVVNIQYIPYIFLFPVFLLSAQPFYVITLHWCVACLILGLHNIICATFKIKSIERSVGKRGAGRRSDSGVVPVTDNDSTGSGSESLAVDSKLHSNTSARARSGRSDDGVSRGKDPLRWALPSAVSIIGAVVSVFVQVYPQAWAHTSTFSWAIFVTFYLVYVSSTYRGSPEITGSRDLRQVSISQRLFPSVSTASLTETKRKAGDHHFDGVDDRRHGNESDRKGEDSLSSPDSDMVGIRKTSDGSGYEDSGGADKSPSWLLSSLSSGIARLGSSVRRYFSGRVVAEQPLDTNQLYVLGFHPHGVVPVTLFWMCTCQVWNELFPGIRCSVLTASVMHVVPLLRDLLQWVGGREVSSSTFRQALRENISCVVVPGGQAEMMESRSFDSDVRIVTKHNGYIRMAIQEGAHLVPIFSFGEVDIMDNVRIPRLQVWFLRRFGAAIPHYPYGYFGLPIPRRVQVMVVVGSPIPTVQNLNPSDGEIRELHLRYLLALRDLFEKYREEAGEPSRRRLVFIADDGSEMKFDTSVPEVDETTKTVVEAAELNSYVTTSEETSVENVETMKASIREPASTSAASASTAAKAMTSIQEEESFEIVNNDF